MDVDDAVDLLIQYFDNISTADGGYGKRAARTLVYLQQTYEEVWNLRDWQFKVTQADDTVGAGAGNTFIALPDDFAELAESGGFFIRRSPSEPWIRIDELFVTEVRDLIERQVAGVDVPEGFAIYSGRVNFPFFSADVETRLVYSKVAKQLAYSPAGDTFEIPLAYHNSVLIAGTIARMARGKGDGRADWKATYDKGLADMILRERPRKTAAQYLPDLVPPMC